MTTPRKRQLSWATERSLELYRREVKRNEKRAFIRIALGSIAFTAIAMTPFVLKVL